MATSLRSVKSGKLTNSCSVLGQTVKNRNELNVSFSEYKKRLDPAASYVIAEKSFDEHGRVDLKEMDRLANAFQEQSTSHKLIYDTHAHKWILVIELKAEVENGFFKSAVLSLALTDVKVYLWSSR